MTARTETQAARLSRILFEARELVDMYGDIVRARVGNSSKWTDRVRDEIDTYRGEKGWSDHGFGGEQ